jgi:D-sedoheptulose 7-phosphate isomerase
MSSSVSYLANYLTSFSKSLETINESEFEKSVNELALLRERNGRLFILGLGGSAANASHAVNDFRKIAFIEAYSPTDNVAEFSARINDNGIESALSDWLIGSRLSTKDICLFFSVGGGDIEMNVSVPLIRALDLTNNQGATSISIVGKQFGYLQKNSTLVINTPLNPKYITPHGESLQALIWHAMVFHPKIQNTKGKWEELDSKTSYTKPR